jgi:hypothetical protein
MTWTDLVSRRVYLAAVLLVQLAACKGDDGDGSANACLPELDLDCERAYDPTFEEFYEREIEPTCGANGSFCHAPSGNKGNLTLGDIDDAYDALIESGLVIPGDPECSVLIQRLESRDVNFVMPQGQRLDEKHLCAIRQWVANGAER